MASAGDWRGLAVTQGAALVVFATRSHFLGDVSGDMARLQSQLSDLAKSMQLAQKSGNTAALDQFRAQYRAVSARLAALRTQANAADQDAAKPSGFQAAVEDVLKVFRGAGVVAAVGLGVLAFAMFKGRR